MTNANEQPSFEEYLGEEIQTEAEKSLAFTVSECLRCWVLPTSSFEEYLHTMHVLRQITDSQIRPEFLRAMHSKFVPHLQEAATAPLSKNATHKNLAIGHKKNVEELIAAINTAIKQLDLPTA